MLVAQLLAELQAISEASMSYLSIPNWMNIHAVDVINETDVVLTTSYPPDGNTNYTVGNLITALQTAPQSGTVFLNNQNWMTANLIDSSSGNAVILTLPNPSNAALQAQITSLTAQVASLSSSLITAQAASGSEATTIAALLLQIAGLSGSLAVAQADSASDAMTIGTLQSALAATASLLTSDNLQITNLENQIVILTTLFSASQASGTVELEEIGALQLEVSNESGTIQLLNVQIGADSASLSTANAAIATLNGQVATLNTLTASLQAEIATLQGELSASQVARPTYLVISPSESVEITPGMKQMERAITFDQNGKIYP